MLGNEEELYIRIMAFAFRGLSLLSTMYLPKNSFTDVLNVGLFEIQTAIHLQWGTITVRMGILFYFILVCSGICIASFIYP